MSTTLREQLNENFAKETNTNPPRFPLPAPMSIYRHDIHSWSWNVKELMQAYEYSKALDHPIGYLKRRRVANKNEI